MNLKPSIIIIIITALFCMADDGYGDPLFRLFFQPPAPHSAVTRALAGAGTALPHGGFDGRVNPALTSAGGRPGSVAFGYGRDPAFDELAMPFGMVFPDVNGAMGFYYSYSRGSRGSAHDAAINFAGRMFEQVDRQGAVEFGLNLRYEQSAWKHVYTTAYEYDTGRAEPSDRGVPEWQAIDIHTVDLGSKGLLIDIGFYQPHVMAGLDFSLVFTNVLGYMWKDTGGSDKTSGWIDGRYRSIIIGALYSFPVMSGVLARIPLDIEMANLFEKAVPNKYVLRTGLDLRIAQNYSLRFGYAHAPEDPLDLITDFDYKNLFFGGFGVSVKKVQTDVFIGKDEFGFTIAYMY